MEASVLSPPAFPLKVPVPVPAPLGRPLKITPPPAFIHQRIAIFDRLWQIQQAALAAKPSVAIKITLPDGTERHGMSWKTTPMDSVTDFSPALAQATVIAKVNGVLWDLTRPFEEDSGVEFLNFENDDEAKAVFWHSSAHILGEALELHHGGCLCYGPPIADGFYYDAFMGTEVVTKEDMAQLEALGHAAIKEKQPFQRLEMQIADLLDMFQDNPFKLRIIKERLTETTTTVYRCGPLIDLCRGPHVRDTSRIKAFQVTKGSTTYWEGNAAAETLQRVYGISFPDKQQLKDWQQRQAEAARRDHRRLGQEQELFFFHELSPGSAFFLPRGAFIYNKLITFMQEAYRQRGFQEVITPNIYNAKLWATSGHWAHYAENMFKFEVEKEQFALKPMNCPGHCLLFAHRPRSYKELPLRFADFGVLHRNELSGALTGLTRVRRFQQDDAHIFCLPTQIGAEIAGCLDFLQHVYGIFGFTFTLHLSTRPENYLGQIETWDMAEAALTAALTTFGHPWHLNPGDGAFYGPKIDITICDALKRAHQCATIQLDFQLPERFALEFVPAPVPAEGSGAQGHGHGPVHRPVIIHRAILGSVERMIAILTENYSGKWPFWLNPRGVCVVPIHPSFTAYAEAIKAALFRAGFQVDVDVGTEHTLKKKIRNAQVAYYNFILVVGQKEMEQQTVNIRTRENVLAGERPLDAVIAHFAMLVRDRPRDENFPAI